MLEEAVEKVNKWISPPSAIGYFVPNSVVLDSTKFADDGAWFLQNARWICFENYNYTSTLTRNPILGNLGTSSEVLSNFQYYYGVQTNEFYNYSSSPSYVGVSTPTVPDQLIRTKVEYLLGKLRKMIESSKDLMSVRSLDYRVALKKQNLRKKLELKKLIDPLMQDNPVMFAPEGVAKVESDEDIDKIIEEWREEIELEILKLGRGIHFEEKMENLFEFESVHQVVGNMCMVDIQAAGNKISCTAIPSYNMIVDKNQIGDYGENAQVGGYVEYMTPSQIFNKWPEVFKNKKQRDFIENMAKRAYSNINKAYGFYNTCPNLLWWDKVGRVAVARTYWLGLSNSRYRVVNGQVGKKATFLADDVEYDVPIGDTYGKKLGSDVQGDNWTYKWHYCDIIGNAIAADYGYVPYQVRSENKYKFPMKPFEIFIHRNHAGFFRSIVSRLKAITDKKESIRKKIQELMDEDIGKVYGLNASLLAKAEMTAPELYQQIRQYKFFLLNDSGEAQNPNDNKRIVIDELDYTMQGQVQIYLQLLDYEDRNMNEITNITNIVQGTQETIVGKGVQAQSQQAAELNYIGLFKGFLTHMSDVMRNCINKAKMISADYGQPILYQIGELHPAIVQIPKDAKYEEYGFWYENSDELEPSRQQAIDSAYFAYAQNPTPDGAKALNNILTLMGKRSSIEKQDFLEKFIVKETAQQQAIAAQENKAESDMQAQGIQMQQQFTVFLQKMKEDNENYRTELEVRQKAIADENKAMAENIKANNAGVQMLIDMQLAQQAANEKATASA